MGERFTREARSIWDPQMSTFSHDSRLGLLDVWFSKKPQSEKRYLQQNDAMEYSSVRFQEAL